ncbi:hypothetical protein ACI2K4_21845 [Micromonospora sp. NPDC050397]|uniref:hypothetical protein n=1 Tax=Micromonospora sp. NPDC050397 TaxID=3364279 RepID=UPI00384C6978
MQLELVHGEVEPTAVAALPQQPVQLYQSSDSFVPDLNEGVRYFPAWGVDRLVVNPHTGSHFVVVGQRVGVLNDDLDRGILDTIRVIKQLAATTFEADGALTLHASAIGFGGHAVAVIGDKGAGKTTTALAAVAAGARLVSNDRVNAWSFDGRTEVQGWTDPIRIILDPATGSKEMISVARYFDGAADRVARDPLPLVAIVLPDVSSSALEVSCVDLDAATAEELTRGHVLPVRARWLGLEPEPRMPPNLPTAPRFLRLRYPFAHAETAVRQLREALGFG